MRLVAAFLTGMFIVGASAAGAVYAAGERDSVRPILDRLAKMSLSEQQGWLRQLEQRAGRAARLAMAPEDAARQEANTRSKLHQKTITWKVLREVIEDTDAREEDAIDRLAKRYQTVVFDKYHDQLEVYGQRQQSWLDVQNAWKAAGGGFEQQGRVIDWLEAAIRSATPGTIGPIPEKPKFESELPEEVEAAKPQAEAEAAKPQAEAEKEPLPEVEKPQAPAKRVDPIDLPSETRVQPPSPAREPAVETAAPPGELPPDSVEVKVDELAVRIGGCNLAFRALEADLDAKGVWTAARLAPLFDRLKILVIRRNDLELFREAVPDEERSSLEPLTSAKGVISQAAGRVFEARGLVADAKFKGTDSQRRAELERLDELSRRLAELAEK